MLSAFVGEIEQTPPPYSAVKVQGRKAYEMAREGEEVELAPRKITVHHLEVLEWAPPEVVIDVHCSSGTYVRSLANDLGAALGCGAYLVGLRRTKSGRFSLREATPLRKLQEAFQAGNWYQYLIPAAEALAEWPAVELNPDDVENVRHGHRVQGRRRRNGGHGARRQHAGRARGSDGSGDRRNRRAGVAAEESVLFLDSQHGSDPWGQTHVHARSIPNSRMYLPTGLAP